MRIQTKIKPLAPLPPEWETSTGLIAYEDALNAMDAHVDAMLAGSAAEKIWLLEHPPLYTAGTSAATNELLQPARFPVYRSGRGGRYTYHGPGQRIAYVMLDLRERGRDVRVYIRQLESWVTGALALLDVAAAPRQGRIGLWINTPSGEEKIAAIGVRIRRWITFHGVSINVNPDLGHFDGIIPCGLADHGVTSLAKLGKNISMHRLDAALKEQWGKVFGYEYRP